MKFSELTIGDVFVRSNGDVHFKTDTERSRKLARWTQRGADVQVEIYEYLIYPEEEVTRLVTERKK